VVQSLNIIIGGGLVIFKRLGGGLVICRKYKQETVVQRPQSPQEAIKPVDYLADILN
jgi:hypothetical protein